MDEFIVHILQDFHFLRNGYLYLLVVIFAVLFLHFFVGKEEESWKRIFPTHLQKYMIASGDIHKTKYWFTVLVFTLVLAVLGLSGPTWKRIKIPGRILETPVVIVLDLSQSMQAKDIQPTRLERAKFKIYDFLEANPEARVALVAFAGTAHTVVPLTYDYKLVKNHVKDLATTIMPFYGSDFSKGIEKAKYIIGENKIPASIVVFTDQIDQPVFEYLNSQINSDKLSFEIFPMATKSGAPVPRQFSKHHYKTKTGTTVLTRITKNEIAKINSLTNATVHQLTMDTSDVEQLATKIKNNLKFSEEAKADEDLWEDYGVYFVVPLVLVVFLYFRKGMKLVFILLGMLVTSCEAKFTFKDLWFTKEYQAQQYYNEKKFEKASDLFESPMRKGVAYYKAGEYEQAVKYFSKDTSAAGKYNLGLAYYQNGDYSNAALAFGLSLDMDSTFQFAKENQQIAIGLSKTADKELEEVQNNEPQKNTSNKNEANKSLEDLGGGGKEATEDEMQKARLEETVETDVRFGEELDELPAQIEASANTNNTKLILRNIDDSPARFLKRKFKYQTKRDSIKPSKNRTRW